MTDDPRKTEPGEESPAGDASAGGPASPATDPGPPPVTASAPSSGSENTGSAPPEAANDREAPPDSDPPAGDPANGDPANGDPANGDPANGDPANGDPAAGRSTTEVTGSEAADSGEISGEMADADPEGGKAEAPALTEEQQRIVDLEIEIAELKDRALRAMADADNARKRASRDVADSRKYGATGLARDVLTVADNLGRALQAVPEVPREEDENLFNLRTGVDMTLAEMLQALERHGVKKVTPETGERFDHNRHQAMFEVPTDELAPGAVAQVVQDGYVIHDRLLRPALVGVARKPPEEAAPEPEEAAEAPVESAAESAEESDAA